MKRNLFIFVIAVLLQPLRADEGMYIPALLNKLNYENLSSMGLKLSPEEIYSVNNSSLKDAIVQFGGGCTGEIVSAEGLLFTNHHCGYGQIQSHSTVEHDYLTNGFWAYDKKDELPNPGLTVKFLVRMEDVTEQITEGLSDSTDEATRGKMIREKAKVIEDSAMSGNHYTAMVRAFAEGNAYYLLVYEIFEDVRLVGTPPNSIGKFGADADNWMWPRHTGDFSIFRVYADSNNKPAPYSENNVPYKPKQFLKISLNGVKDGDFAMVLGYPGRTDRFLTSFGVRNEIEVTAPSVVKVRGAKLDVIDKFAADNDKIRIQYSAKRARISNYWKYYIGAEKQLRKNNVFQTKQKQEREFLEWAAIAPNGSKYSEALAELKKSYAKLAKVEKMRVYYGEAFFGTEMFSMARRFTAVEAALQNGGSDELSKETAKIKQSFDNFFKDYNKDVDRELMTVLFKLLYQDVDHYLLPKYFVEFVEKNKQDFNKIANDIFAKTMFCDCEKMEEFLDNPKSTTLEKDPAYKLLKVFTEDIKITIPSSMYEQLAEQKRIYVKGVMEMQPERALAPDANSTMRFSYGSIKSYSPADAIQYNETTTLKGVMDKEEPNNPDFVVPSRLKELYNTRDYGVYGDSILVTCFLSTNDITGGNSGSPMLNGKGELTGLAFDGNWEAMSGDIYFDPVFKRTIAVDIRYVLFIIDKFAGAKNLIDELVISNE
ncbi:MAG: S46 family peptidase [Bacteroidales bacterium]|jgi:hypothetical protein|nr:S46 family peptidase [Bacteroidales bacterium]